MCTRRVCNSEDRSRRSHTHAQHNPSSLTLLRPQFNESASSWRLVLLRRVQRAFPGIHVSGAAYTDSLDILQPTSLSLCMILEMEERLAPQSAFVNINITEQKMTSHTKQWYISVLAWIHIHAFCIEVAGGSYTDPLSLAAASIDAETAVGNAAYTLPAYNHDCVRSSGSAVLMQVWITMLAKLPCSKDLG